MGNPGNPNFSSLLWVGLGLPWFPGACGSNPPAHTYCLHTVGTTNCHKAKRPQGGSKAQKGTRHAGVAVRRWRRERCYGAAGTDSSGRERYKPLLNMRVARFRNKGTDCWWRYLIIASLCHLARSFITLESHFPWRSAMAPPARSDRALSALGEMPVEGNKTAACRRMVLVTMDAVIQILVVWWL